MSHGRPWCATGRKLCHSVLDLDFATIHLSSRGKPWQTSVAKLYGTPRGSSLWHTTVAHQCGTLTWHIAVAHHRVKPQWNTKIKQHRETLP